jgi:hypothetical protein
MSCSNRFQKSPKKLKSKLFDNLNGRFTAAFFIFAETVVPISKYNLSNLKFYEKAQNLQFLPT